MYQLDDRLKFIYVDRFKCIHVHTKYIPVCIYVCM